MKVSLHKFLIIGLGLATFKASAQGVAINTTGAAPVASAIFDISTTTNKGVLLPQVALTATNAAGPVTSPATGLMVYNTATAGASPNNVVPGYYYNAGTGAAPNWIRFAGGNTKAWTLNGNAGTTAGTDFIGTTDAQDLVFKTNSTEKGRFNNTSNALEFGNMGSAASPILTWTADQNTGLFRQGADVMSVTTGGTERWRFNSGGELLATGDGTAAAPILSWTTDVNNGIYRIGADIMGFTTGGTEAMRITAAQDVNIGGTSTDRLFVTSADVVRTTNINNSSTGDCIETFATGSVGYGAIYAYNDPTQNGTDYGVLTSNAALQGQADNAGNRNYTFGAVADYIDVRVRRTGGVKGGSPAISANMWSCLSYVDAGNTRYSMYYNNATYTLGSGGGKYSAPSSNNEVYSGVGIGGYADLIGAHIRGGQYGIFATGKRAAFYSNGLTIGNSPMIIVNDNGGNQKTVSYSITSENNDLLKRGVATLNGERVFVSLDEQYINQIESLEAAQIFITTKGKSSGVYLEKIEGNTGFWISKNDVNDPAVVNINWLVIAERKNKIKLPEEFLDPEFDNKLSVPLPNTIVKGTDDFSAQPFYISGDKLIWGESPEPVNAGSKKYVSKKDHSQQLKSNKGK